MRAPTPLPRLLADDDWQVRLAGLEDTASKTKVELSKSLAEWIGRARDVELLRACMTGLHAAGKKNVTLEALLGKEAKALAACRSKFKELKELLGIELYDERLPIRREALLHGATALGVKQGRIVLDAVATHPATFDALILETLQDIAATDARTAPAQLLEAAGPNDVAVMNRLLAVYGKQRDTARVTLAKEKDPTVRKEAITTLARLAPLSESELLAALLDEEPPIRRGAAHGLGRGLGGTIATAADHYILGKGAGATSLAQQLALLKFTGDANDENCSTVAMGVWKRSSLEPSLRRRALPVAAGCSWSSARDEVETILRTESGGLPLAAAVASLGSAPLNDQLLERLEQSLKNDDAGVRAAGCEAISAHRWRGGITRVQPLLKDVDAAVRAAAIDTLLMLDAPSIDVPIAHLLDSDPSVDVRVAAARALGILGGPRALATLTTASRNDTNSNVKLVAAESLRKLGSGSRPP